MCWPTPTCCRISAWPTSDNAASALALLDWLNSNDATSIYFDVTLNGFGRSPSPLKLALEPPFLAMTLAVAITDPARGVAGRRAVRRAAAARAGDRLRQGGADRQCRRAGAQGRPLRDAGQSLCRDDRANGPARSSACSPHLRDEALDAHLDALGRGARFTELAQAARDARDRHSVLSAAQALHRWLWEKNR